MTAVWRDGMKKEMAEITVGEFKQREAAQDKEGQNRIGWSQVHPVTKSLIQVKPRADRNPLVSLYEQGCQIAQVRTQGFHDHDPKKQQEGAMKFLTDIAIMYCRDFLDKDNIKTYVKEQLQKVEGYEKRLKAVVSEKLRAKQLQRNANAKKDEQAVKRPAAQVHRKKLEAEDAPQEEVEADAAEAAETKDEGLKKQKTFEKIKPARDEGSRKRRRSKSSAGERVESTEPEARERVENTKPEAGANTVEKDDYEMADSPMTTTPPRRPWARLERRARSESPQVDMPPSIESVLQALG